MKEKEYLVLTVFNYQEEEETKPNLDANYSLLMCRSIEVIYST
jgi:hypothetical protein